MEQRWYSELKESDAEALDDDGEKIGSNRQIRATSGWLEYQHNDIFETNYFLSSCKYTQPLVAPCTLLLSVFPYLKLFSLLRINPRHPSRQKAEYCVWARDKRSHTVVPIHHRILTDRLTCQEEWVGVWYARLSSLPQPLNGSHLHLALFILLQ